MRTIHQAVHIWGGCPDNQQRVYDPAKWGWVRDSDSWTPLWITILEVSQVCSELLHCSCKKGSIGNCKCRKAGKMECQQLIPDIAL